MSHQIHSMAAAKAANVSLMLALRSTATTSCSPAQGLSLASAGVFSRHTAIPSRRPYHILREPCLSAPCRTSLPSSPLCRHKGRACFSTTTPALAGRQTTVASPAVMMAKQQKDMQRSGAVYDYVGLIEGTIVKPRQAPALPSWTRDPRRRAYLEFLCLYARVFQEFKHITYWWTNKELRGALKNRKDIPGIARSLYIDMYQSLSNGNVSAMGSQMATGLMSQLSKRVADRPADIVLEWEIKDLEITTELCSFRMELFPTQPGQPKEEHNGVVQAIVLIRSEQSLLRKRLVSTQNRQTKTPTKREVYLDRDGKPLSGPGAIRQERERSNKHMAEYVVVQRPIRRGALHPWQIWGVTKESSLESIKADSKKQEETLRAYKAQKQ